LRSAGHRQLQHVSRRKLGIWLQNQLDFGTTDGWSSILLSRSSIKKADAQMHNNPPRREALINSKILNSLLTLFGPSPPETLRFDPFPLDRVLDANGVMRAFRTLDIST
jgi:hypothetical protein